MGKRILWFSILAIGLCAGLAATQEEKSFTADRHKKNNIKCAGCHKEDQPKTAAPENACITCHQSMEKVAERTKDFEKNPHRNHLVESSEVACTQCHQGHKADVVICENCHSGMRFEKRQAEE